MKRYEERKEDYSKALERLVEALEEQETELNIDGFYIDLNLHLSLRGKQ